MRIPSLYSLLFVALGVAAEVPIYRQKNAPINSRVADLVSRMTLEEKVAQLLSLWTQPQNNYDFIIRTYGYTSVGAVYGQWVTNTNDTRNRWEALNDLQSYMLNHTRLGIPIDIIQETLHGGMDNGTIFPMPLGLGATWNVQLINQIGRVIGLEARIAGVTRALSPELQVDTDPRFGRTEEAFGEDPKLVSDLGAAYTVGMTDGNTAGPSEYLSRYGVATEAKHFAAYGYAGKDAYRTDVSDATLFNVYLRPWKAYAQVGGRGIMVSHQETNGIPNHMSSRMQTTIFRNMFGGAEALIASDYGDVGNLPGFGTAIDCTDAAVLALTAGLDQDLGATCYGTLLNSTTAGLVNVSFINRAVSNVLRTKFATGLFDGSALVNVTALPEVLDQPAHRQLAYQAAVESAVLLKNSGILPMKLGPGGYQRVALIGPNAGCVNQSDPFCDAILNQVGGYTNYGAHVVTLREALETSAGHSGFSVQFARGANIDNENLTMISAAVAAARGAEVAIIVLGDSSDGYAAGSCGEGIDADSLDFVGSQLPLLYAIATQTTTPIVLVSINGRPFTLGSGPSSLFGANNAILDSIDALLVAWRPGEEGGNAILDLLVGAANPSGRLAQNWVRHVGAIRGPANPWFQQRNFPTTAYVTEPATAWFPFGFGLSYTHFNITSIEPIPQKMSSTDAFNITAYISSAGPHGKLVVQVYYSQAPPTKYVRYERALLCYSKVDVPANANRVPVTIPCKVIDMEWFDSDANDYVVYPGQYTLHVGQSSVHIAATANVTITAA